MRAPYEPGAGERIARPVESRRLWLRAMA